MNKKFTKKTLIETSLTMDTDTFNKMRGTLTDDDKVKVVAKGSLPPISEDDDSIAPTKPNVISTLGKDLKIGQNLYNGKEICEITDLEAKGDAELLVKVKDPSGKESKFLFDFHKPYSVCQDTIGEDDERSGISTHYGYDPELDGDSWEEFLNALDQDQVEHELGQNAYGEINEVKLKKI